MIRLIERHVSLVEAEIIVRGGAWQSDGVGDKGEPKWAAEGSITGQQIRVVFVETTTAEGQAVIEVLHVVTVIIRTNRRR